MTDEFDLLVIDDEPVILNAAKKILMAEGIRTDLAENGERALSKIAGRRYRAVLCDLVLPHVGGFDLVAQIRDRLPDVPIVLITGYATLENATEGFGHGAFDFIPKPFDYGELLGVVRRALDFPGWKTRMAPRPELGGPERRLFGLGRHAWVALETDGSARIGMGETFATLNGDFENLELPEVGALLLQGNQCARWMTGGRFVHRLWTPLSGRVAETSSGPFADPERRSPDKAHDNWVIHLIPSNLEPELPKLIRR